MTRKLLEALVGRWQGSIAVPLAKIGLGIVIPGLIVGYAIACMLSRHAYILDRTGRPADVKGLPALAVAIAYAAVGLFIYVPSAGRSTVSLRECESSPGRFS